MADIKNIQVDGVDYDIKDETARNRIGDLSNLNVPADDLVAAVNAAAESGGECNIQRIESDSSNYVYLKDLASGVYILYGYFRPYNGSGSRLAFDNILVSVAADSTESHILALTTINSKVDFFTIKVDSTQTSGYAYARTNISLMDLYGLLGKVGDPSELTTTATESLVAAINELVQTAATEAYVKDYAQPKGDYALASQLPTVPTQVSQLENDAGYITGYTESDPTVPAWAKAANKPTYTAAEVGALPSSTVIPTVPTKVSAFTNDAGYLTQHQDISGKADKTGLTLGRHENGLLYLYIDGVPVGDGVELPTGGIDGYITAENQVVFKNLPDGEYTLAYIGDDGSIVPLGAMEKGTNVYYSVTNTLTQCTNSNTAIQAVGGENYSATITAASGYELDSVVVTMGGVDISATAVNGGSITIPNVTGDIVITAVATEAQAGPAYTNLADPTSPEWIDGYRISSSGSMEVKTGVTTMNTIQAGTGDIVRVKGATGIISAQYKDGVFDHRATVVAGGSQYFDNVVIDGDYTQFSPAYPNVTSVRFYGTLSGTAADVIITVNEEIV